MIYAHVTSTTYIIHITCFVCVLDVKCEDVDAKMNDLYLLKPESLYLAEVVANNSLRRVIRHLPNTLTNWRCLYISHCLF
jgi:hypothetical protein